MISSLSLQHSLFFHAHDTHAHNRPAAAPETNCSAVRSIQLSPQDSSPRFFWPRHYSKLERTNANGRATRRDRERERERESSPAAAPASHGATYGRGEAHTHMHEGTRAHRAARPNLCRGARERAPSRSPLSLSPSVSVHPFARRGEASEARGSCIFGHFTLGKRRSSERAGRRAGGHSVLPLRHRDIAWEGGRKGGNLISRSR